ncbi:hypothetical protein E1B28_001617 [Marasmius oreades]|uniref:Uncharacterized protein n=1 Tax=Marasmius oreades TaxID=181124 RepID=A0A9P8AFC8_9AGAR|nr:uncharacterized protein E1B28_001617 [Marasmius oreades]KAG7099806.1 hypothetical protein E1B28_001617 [Marasmius oreades]
MTPPPMPDSPGRARTSTMCRDATQFSFYLTFWETVTITEGYSTTFSEVIYPNSILHLRIPLPPPEYIQQSLVPEFYEALREGHSPHIITLEGPHLLHQFSLKELQGYFWTKYVRAMLESPRKSSVLDLMELKFRELNQSCDNMFSSSEEHTLSIPVPSNGHSFLQNTPKTCTVDTAALCRLQGFNVTPGSIELLYDLSKKLGKGCFEPPHWDIIFFVIEAKYEKVEDGGRQVIMDLVVLSEHYKILRIGAFRLWGMAIATDGCRIYSGEVDDAGKMTIRLDPRYRTLSLQDAYGWLQLYEIFGSIAADARVNLIAKVEAIARKTPFLDAKSVDQEQLVIRQPTPHRPAMMEAGIKCLFGLPDGENVGDRFEDEAEAHHI